MVDHVLLHTYVFPNVERISEPNRSPGGNLSLLTGFQKLCTV